LKGIKLAGIILIAVVAGFAGGYMLNAYIAKAWEEPKKYPTAEELARDEQGFIVFGKITRYWRGTLSVLGLSDGEEISLNNVEKLFAFIGSATFEVQSPGLYRFIYSVMPSLEGDKYMDLKYLQVIIFPKDAVNIRGEVDPSKIIAWEIYRYKEFMDVEFYADKPGIYIALFGPAEGSLLTLKGYELKKYIPNIVRIKIEGISDPKAQVKVLSLEADDAVVQKVGDFIGVKVIRYR